MMEEMVQNILKKNLESHIEMFRAMSEDISFRETPEHAAALAEDTVRRKGALFLCGNGGSAADAQHIATDERET